jgi:hypothetical protein
MALALCACATVESPIVAEAGTEFGLPLGKTAVVNASGVRITFTRVREDSRCPIDVQCVWAGDAKIELAVSRSGTPEDVKLISLTAPNNETISGDLRIRLVGLAPVPRQAESGRPRAYVAQLVVNRG